jgi:hypothetical protein
MPIQLCLERKQNAPANQFRHKIEYPQPSLNRHTVFIKTWPGVDIRAKA